MLRVNNTSSNMKVRHRDNNPFGYKYKGEKRSLQTHIEHDEVSEDGSDEHDIADNFIAPTPITVRNSVQNTDLITVQISKEQDETIEHLESVCGELLKRVDTLENDKGRNMLYGKEILEDLQESVHELDSKYNETKTQLGKLMVETKTQMDVLSVETKSRLTVLETRKSSGDSVWSFFLVLLLAIGCGVMSLQLISSPETDFLPHV